MKTKGFNEVFKNIKLSANVATNLKNTFVDRLDISIKEKCIYIDIVSPTFVDESCINDLSDDIKNFFEGIDLVKPTLRYDMHSKSDEEIITLYYDKLKNIVKTESECCYPIFEDASWSIDGDKLVFSLNSNNAYPFYHKNIDKKISQALSSRFDLKYKVEFVGRSKTEDELLEFEESVNRAIENGLKNKPLITSSQAEEKKPAVSNSEFAPRPRRSANATAKEITEAPISIKEAYASADEVVIEGRVFADTETRETKNGSFIVKTFITDNTESVTAKLFAKPDVYKAEIAPLLKVGSYVKVKGKISDDNFERGEQVLSVTSLQKGNAPDPKQDNYPDKRVELHLHTNMSMMDAITSATEYINRAASWGHKAIAITDHGVVQAYPEALNAADKLKKKGTPIKVLYGCEGYMVNDMGTVVRNSHGERLDGEFVVFDLETTGLHKETDKIIEIGAVKVVNGKITEKFSEFIDPEMPIPPEITKLTSITDDDVKDAQTAEITVPKFLDFVGNSVLVAHNAGFDVGFIRQWAIQHGRDVQNAVIDTVDLGKLLSPGLKNYKLDTLCEEYGVSLEHHHRAVDDAGATAELFVKFTERLFDMDVYEIDKLNDMASEKIDKRSIPKYYHIIIFAKNQTGLKNLYKLVSDSHIKYYKRRPKMPKSELIKYREGLIFGSACEAGDLYTAVYENYTEEEIKELVDFYDYLEIQPIGNNKYMIGNNSKSGKSVENEARLIEINKKIVELGEKYNKPVVATCDCHFIDPEDEVFRRIVQTGEGYDNVDDQPPLYFRTTEEMLKEFEYLGEEKAKEVVITNTNLIADMMEDVLPVPRETYPPHMENANEDFERITYERTRSIYGDELPEIVEKRLKRELDSIIGNGYAVLYMIAQKLVQNSVDNGYIVGSRGSVGSSFAATMAGITEVNPLQPHYVCKKCKYSDFDSPTVKEYARESMSGFDLPDKLCPVCGEPLHKDGQAIPFETFLGFDGDKEPDIDLNFSGEYQTRAHKYCETLFGEGFVFKAGTISTLQEKTVYGYINKYCEKKGIQIRSSEKKRLAMGCVGVKRSTGQHPGGLMVVPSDNDILNFTPIQRPANDFNSDVTTTHFDYHSISGRLLKLDMLGHDVPTIIRIFYDITGVDPTTVPLDERKTISLFTSPDALGVTSEEIGCETGSLGLPEFGTNFVRQMLMETKPSTFSDLVRISGLSHGTDVWVGNAKDLVNNNVVTIKDVIATRDDIMGYLINYGIENFTAFSIMEFVRKGKAQKDPAKFAEYEKIMVEHDVPRWYIDSCKKIQYLFPKGHAVAYVTNTIRIGYFKIHYPLAFYAATFSVKSEDFDYELLCFGPEKIKQKMAETDSLGDEAAEKDKKMRPVLELVIEMYARGFSFAPIDLYQSEASKFRVIKNKSGEEVILPPFCALQGLGQNAAEYIVNARKDGEFSTVENLRERTHLGNKLIELLRDSGVLGNMRDTDQLTLFDN